ncbi:MAG: type II toxin-antitoxin system death-on-curing family toxin [Parachlamydiales bacterium]|nr:type II toxin-antitoxin system death-on-curing family toxin [Parachlamydiales bacterium]
MEIYFLTLDDVIEIHLDQLSHYGGKKGIREQNLLISAISQPFSTFNGVYLHKTIHDKAAAYLFHICQNHPFIDGNKRVALVSALIFLAMNQQPIDYQENDLEEMTLKVASGKMKKEAIAEFLSKCLG